jgi:2-keto-4-pentenoate hydratase/2-oxohepta-3-ene-1,7-dioic acid hydratase in catechol pathway
MKLCRYDENRLGVVRGDNVHDVTDVLGHLPPLRWPVAHGDHFVRHFEELRPALSEAAKRSEGMPISAVSLLSPVANPSKIIAAPVNYAKHVAEARADAGINFGADIKTIDHYGLFLKSNTSVVGPAEGVVLPEVDRRIDHEVEIVVIIGKECERVSEKQAFDVVFGYCLGLDMSVRGTEDRSWRKSYDTFTVLGPHIVTADEISDPANMSMSLAVNGTLRQNASTSALIFDVPRLIAYASAAYRLYPGDVIMTGTPEGVAPVGPGDTLVAKADGLGEMVVRVSRRLRSEEAA